MPLPLRRSNRKQYPDSRVRVAREVSKAKAAPAGRVCVAVSRGCLVVRVAREVSKAKAAPVDRACLVDSRDRVASRGCLVVRVAPVVSKARVAREHRADPLRRDLRTQLLRRRQQRIPLKTLTLKTPIPRLSNEELRVGVLVAAMASGHPYFFS